MRTCPISKLLCRAVGLMVLYTFNSDTWRERQEDPEFEVIHSYRASVVQTEFQESDYKGERLLKKERKKKRSPKIHKSQQTKGKQLDLLYLEFAVPIPLDRMIVCLGEWSRGYIDCSRGLVSTVFHCPARH